VIPKETTSSMQQLELTLKEKKKSPKPSLIFKKYYRSD